MTIRATITMTDKMCGALCGECDTTCGEEECWMRFLKKWMEGLNDHR